MPGQRWNLRSRTALRANGCVWLRRAGRWSAEGRLSGRLESCHGPSTGTRVRRPRPWTSSLFCMSRQWPETMRPGLARHLRWGEVRRLLRLC